MTNDVMARSALNPRKLSAKVVGVKLSTVPSLNVMVTKVEIPLSLMSVAKKSAPSARTLPLVKVIVSASSSWLAPRKPPPT